jgi:hypothetical protein
MAKHNKPCMIPIPKLWGLGIVLKHAGQCVYKREKESTGSIWSRVTCLALPLATAQSLECRAPGDPQSLRHLTVAIRNKRHKQINKQYTKQCLMTKQTVQNMLLVPTNA